MREAADVERVLGEVLARLPPKTEVRLVTAEGLVLEIEIPSLSQEAFDVLLADVRRACPKAFDEPPRGDTLIPGGSA